MSVKNVVTQDKRAGLLVDERLTNNESLRQTIRAGLYRVLNGHTPLGTITQQSREARRILGGTDEQNLADTAEHECAERVINHRLVVHRHELFTHGLRHRIQTGARASR